MRARYLILGLIVPLAALVASRAHGDEAVAPGRWPLLEPAVTEYRWTFLVPEWTVEARKVETRVYAPRFRVKSVGYSVPGFTTERRTIGRIPEFSCKYIDGFLPNECRTTWRDVRVDVPMLVARHDYVDVDVAEWSWQDRHTTIEVPRLAWKEETLIVSIPVLAIPR